MKARTMLQKFPLKRKFMVSATTRLPTSNQQLSSNSSYRSRLSHETSYDSKSMTCNSLDQLRPILQNSLVTVKVQNPGKLLVDRLAELYTSLESDVSVVCGRSHDTLKAHQFVMSTGSGYFRDALKVAQCKHPIIVVENVPGEVMGRVLEYLYLGDVPLKNESEFKQFSSAKYLLLFGILDEQYSVKC